MGASPLPVADPNDTQAWCRAFFAQLVACGVAHVAASPGSRSTPDRKSTRLNSSHT